MHLCSFFAQTVTFFLVFRSTSNYRAKTRSCSQLSHTLFWLHGQRLKVSRPGSALYEHLHNSENLTADLIDLISPLNTRQLFELHSVVLSTFLFSSFFSIGVCCALGLCYGHVLLLPLETALRSLFLLRRSKVLRGTRSRGLASTFFSLAGVAVRLLVRMRMASRVPLLTRLLLANLSQALFCTRSWPSFRVPRTRASDRTAAFVKHQNCSQCKSTG